MANKLEFHIHILLNDLHLTGGVNVSGLIA